MAIIVTNLQAAIAIAVSVPNYLNFLSHNGTPRIHPSRLSNAGQSKPKWIFSALNYFFQILQRIKRKDSYWTVFARRSKTAEAISNHPLPKNSELTGLRVLREPQEDASAKAGGGQAWLPTQQQVGIISWFF